MITCIATSCQSYTIGFASSMAVAGVEELVVLLHREDCFE